MATKAEDLFGNLDMRDAMRQWARISNNIWSDSISLGQPVIEAYLKSLSNAAGDLDKAYRKSCEIPETQCPPYCVCELEWDAYEGDVVNGTIDINNTGKQDSQFSLSTDEFRTTNQLTTVKPKLDPVNFVLKTGESKRVKVTFKIESSMAPNQTYRAEVKIAGRYEQCVRLAVNVQRKQQPYCTIEHGEIPKRIVAHHWYDHFQCEELCFEPVRHPTQNEPPKRATAATRAAAKRKSKR